MEKRINQVEFDEFEKLLGEIPNVTSGAPSSGQPRSTYPSKGPTNGTFGKRLLNDRSSLDENLSAKDIQQFGAHQEDPKLPDNQSLTSAFAELSFNDMSSSLVHGQYLNGIHEVPCSFDYLSSLGPSLQNSFTRVDPEIGFQYVPNVPNVQGVEFPLFPNQQLYLHMQRLRQPQTTWGTADESQYYQIHQQYLGMTPHFRIQRPILANGNMTPQHLLSQNFQNSRDDIHHFGLSNQEDLWNKANNVPRGVNFGRLWKLGFPEKVLPKSLGYNSHRNEMLLDVNQNERVLSNNHYHRMPTNSCDDLKCNSLRSLLQKCSYNSIDEVVGRIYLMAKDQNGCRFLQRKFTEGTQKDIGMIFSEVIMHVVELMMDPFGNYLVQKLLEVCNEDQHMQILRTITRKSGDLVRISCDMHGTRAVQKIVETLKTPGEFLLFVSSLKPGIVTLMKNINGNHVAQRCLQYLLPEYSEFLYEAAFASCVELATDRHGCCVLQKCLSCCVGEKRHRLICKITSNALILAQDQYGNYVVQFVLKTRVSWAILNVLNQLEGNYGDLSMQKYSSNVIEKCLKHAKEEQQYRIMQELISDHRFDQILQDPYGNYVIQAAMKRSKATLCGTLVEAIRPHIPLLRTSPYGKKVLQAIARTSHLCSEQS